MSNLVDIQLSKEEAFGLFEFLARYAYHGELSINSEAEALALRETCIVLDNELVEQFRSDYLKLVERTKKNKGYAK